MEQEFSLLKMGVDLFLNFKFGEAEQVLSALSETNPAFALHLAEIAVIKAVLTEDKDDAKVAFDRLDTGYKLASKLKRNPPQQFPTQTVLLAKIVQGEISLLDAALKFRLQRQVRGFVTFRKGWKCFSSALEYRKKLPPSAECYQQLSSYLDCGVGFYHFIVSIIPKEFQWVAEGIGFEGNRELGLQEIKASIDANGPGTPKALLHFVWIHSFFNEDFVEGERWLKELLARYPTGVLFQYLGGYVYRKQGKLDLAEQVFLSAQKNSNELKQCARYCDYELGYNAYLNQRWEQAAELLQAFFNSSTSESFRCYGLYQLAMCYEMMGRYPQAMETMKSLLPYVRKNYDYDEFAERKAKKYIAGKAGLTEFERNYHIVTVHHEACRWQEGLDDLKSLETLVSADEEKKARVVWAKAVCLHKLGRLNEAKNLFQDVIGWEKAVTGKDSLMVIPHSLCSLGEILLEEKQKEAADRTFKKAKTYTGYDFQQLLSWRIKRNSDKLAK